MKWLLLAIVIVGFIQQRSCQSTSRISCLVTPSSQFITPHGEPCCFPFVYQNMLFYSCTDYGHKRPWCSTTSEYSGKWGDCRTVNTGTRTTLHPQTGPCSYAYTILANTNSWRGVLMPANLTTVATCRDYCDAVGLSCVGFDYDAVQSPNRCYMHSSQTILQRNPGGAPGVTQYVKDPNCFYKSPSTRNACFNIRRPNTHSPGGTEIRGVSNLSSCMDACACRDDCLGFDFRVDGSRCYIHNDPAKFIDRRPKLGVNQYEKTPCT